MEMRFLVIFVVIQLSLGPSVESVELGQIQTYEDFERYGFNLSEIEPYIVSDAFLTTPELIKKYGYPVEVHSVYTPDGYILEMHRIPRPGGIPVYLQHGIMDSSAGWIIMGPKTAFAYLLADEGYDVWMGNIRGNRYSRKHLYLNPKSGAFWDYSFNEIGRFDVPAMVDYVLEKTGKSKLHYVGHSQGTTAFWAMCAQRPGYCDKIISMQALAPIAFMQKLKSPPIRVLAPFVNQLDFIFKLVGAHEFLPNNDFFKMAGQIICNEKAITQVLCSNIIFLLTGYNSEQLNKTMLPAILGHLPAGSSTKQFIHYGQLFKSGRFRQFDYGLFGNKREYGSLSPPSYDLKKVTAPVALHYASNDWLANIRDVKKLQSKLPNVIKEYLVPSPKFNHLDFMLAMNSRDMVQREVVGVMRMVETVS